MNERIKLLAKQAGIEFVYDPTETPMRAFVECWEDDMQKFAKLIVEATLDQVKERAYYTGDRDWSDEVDRQWIQLEFGYGPLQDAKNGIFK